MGKLYVPQKARTPVDRVRQLLDRAEEEVSTLRGTGPEALQLLHLLDEIDDELSQLEHRKGDVRVERTNLETIQRRLKDRQRRFLREVGGALERERARIEPARGRWWWYLDEAAAKERRRKVLRIGAGAIAVIASLTVAWLAYQRFLAPPPEVSQAYRQMESGKRQLEEGDAIEALAAFSTAATLTPDDPEPWLWKGVVHHQLDAVNEAEEAFDAARRLYDTRFDFVLNRGRVYLQTGAIEQAESDVETALAINPDSGWGYYLRAGIAVRRGDLAAALADLEEAARLAEESGDAELQAMTSTQRASLLRMMAVPTATP